MLSRWGRRWWWWFHSCRRYCHQLPLPLIVGGFSFGRECNRNTRQGPESIQSVRTSRKSYVVKFDSVNITNLYSNGCYIATATVEHRTLLFLLLLLLLICCNIVFIFYPKKWELSTGSATIRQYATLLSNCFNLFSQGKYTEVTYCF